ncbi:MAG TPA: hypothetical protein VFG54_21100 [Prolixibacteraceae bacterium]|nr:hypothetical protein [Prolixibacteraceae bacterium]
MYTGFLHLHDGLRWLLMLAFLMTLIKYVTGWLGDHAWKKLDNTLGIILTALMDLQLLTGLVLYFFLSPVTKIAFSDFGGAMKNPDLRFYAVEHLTMMLIAIILVHIGRAKSKKAVFDKSKFKLGAIFFLIALVVVLAGIPWNRL